MKAKIEISGDLSPLNGITNFKAEVKGDPEAICTLLMKQMLDHDDTAALIINAAFCYIDLTGGNFKAITDIFTPADNETLQEAETLFGHKLRKPCAPPLGLS